MYAGQVHDDYTHDLPENPGGELIVLRHESGGQNNSLQGRRTLFA